MGLTKSKNQKITTLRISKSVHDELSAMGNLGETYESVIVKLIKFYKKEAGVESPAKIITPVSPGAT